MKTCLWERHKQLGAKMVDFAGWEMPIQYQGILHEHEAVRQKVGLFDVSHMARVAIHGPDASCFLEWLSTNTLQGPMKATYTCFCNATGGTVDDAIIYKESETALFVILNAARREADLAHFYEQAKGFNIAIEECYRHEGILALQGPEAEHYFPKQAPMTFRKEGDLIIAGTGYTGAGGIEIFAPQATIGKLWDHLIQKGVTPIGLGARDTLRLEKGFALYGHELSPTISPTESVSAWTVKTHKTFFGKEQLSTRRKAYGIRLTESSIAREGFPVFFGEEKIGSVTSGGYSPTLKVPLALILSEKKLQTDDQVTVLIRERKVAATVTRLPFL